MGRQQGGGRWLEPERPPLSFRMRDCTWAPLGEWFPPRLVGREMEPFDIEAQSPFCGPESAGPLNKAPSRAGGTCDNPHSEPEPGDCGVCGTFKVCSFCLPLGHWAGAPQWPGAGNQQARWLESEVGLSVPYVCYHSKQELEFVILAFSGQGHSSETGAAVLRPHTAAVLGGAPRIRPGTRMVEADPRRGNLGQGGVPLGYMSL
jgi:hypothetical protein